MATRREVTCDRCGSTTNNTVSAFSDNSWKLVFANYESENPEELALDLCQGCSGKVMNAIKEAMKVEMTSAPQSLVEIKESAGMES